MPSPKAQSQRPASERRVALCIQCPLLQHGGVEVLVKALLSGLQDRYRLYLVSEDASLESLGSPWTSLLDGHFNYSSTAQPRQQTRQLLDWSRAARLDLLHFHLGGTYAWNSRSWSNCPITACSSAGLRCVSTNHGAFGFWEFVGPQRSRPYRLAALCLCWPAKVRQIASVSWEATVSRHDLQAVQRWFRPVAGRFCQVYHSILDESTIPLLPKKRIVLCLGTVGKRKGQPVLANAFGRVAAKHPDWRLMIAGRHADDGTPAELMRTIASVGISERTEVLRDVTDSQARNLLAEAGIFAMPSLAEGLGLSLQEALYGRAACVGSNVGGIPDLIIHGKTGILVPSGDSACLADALDVLMTDTELRGRLGSAGREHVVTNGMLRTGMVERYRTMYDELLRLH